MPQKFTIGFAAVLVLFTIVSMAWFPVSVTDILNSYGTGAAFWLLVSPHVTGFAAFILFTFDAQASARTLVPFVQGAFQRNAGWHQSFVAALLCLAVAIGVVVYGVMWGQR
ncbi:hypothetical protein [uncultured Litoreibacter sp.]|uniref:hypothetical protein n=1 Tax=uncultured Litoreibacter sp. TaxID=1392394 RepID=UPI0026018DD3|nr:hypothetical protein [uncultured Litoreibacter sp.]